MEYTIVSAYDVSRVIQEVNKRLKDGWKLFGHLAVSAVPDQDGDLYAQAMVKENKPIIKKPIIKKGRAQQHN